MNRQFSGWPEAAFDVLLKLEGEPSSSTREGLRKDRERLVRRPMIDLFTDIAAARAEYDNFSVWAYGKTAWWWQNQCGIVRIEPQIELSVRLDLDGLWVSGGWSYATPDQVARYRGAVADDGTGSELVELTSALQQRGFELGGTTLKRVPRGFAPDHPRADLLRHRAMSGTTMLGAEPWLHTPDAVDHVIAAYDELRPLIEWLVDNIYAPG